MSLLASLSRMAVGTLNAAGARDPETTHTVVQEGSAHLSSVTGTRSPPEDSKLLLVVDHRQIKGLQT